MKTNQTNSADSRIDYSPRIIYPTEIPMFGTREEYVSPTDGKIAIVNHGIPEDCNGILTPEIINTIKGMNFNAIMTILSASADPKDEEFVVENTDLYKSFRNLNGQGLKLIIRHWLPYNNHLEANIGIDNSASPNHWINTNISWLKMTETVLDIIGRSEIEDNLGGWFVCDEPSYSVFWRLLEFKDSILSVYDEKGISNPHPIYANLYPSTNEELANGYAETLNLYTGDIQKKVMLNSILTPYTENYYKAYQSVFDPALWHFDYYCFLAHNNKHPFDDTNDNNNQNNQDHYNPNKPVLRSTFFESMMRIKKMSDITGRPFWAFVLSYFHESDVQYARPTLGTMRFAAFCYLAFGAKGISYWESFVTIRRSVYEDEPYNFKTAAPVVIIADDYDKEDGSILNEKDHPTSSLPKTYITTDIYCMIKIINQDINAVSSILYDSTFVEGGACIKIPKGYDKDYNIKEDSGIQLIHFPFGNMTDAQGDVGFIITRLINPEGKNVYVVVNQDYENPQLATIKFKPGINVRHAEWKYPIKNEITKTLPPGGWMVLVETD